MPISRIESNSIAPSQTLTTPIIATTMGVGGATPAGSGSGITFPATQSGSSDVNTLDDYEEGTWTPAIKGGTTAGTYAYEAGRTGGRYTKVGNLVTIWGVCRISSITSAGSGSLVITGLPFPSGPNMASIWTNSDGIQVAMYGAGVNSSATTYPPPFIADTDGSGTTTATVLSYGKNYNVQTDITALSAANWIYLISGTYTTAT